ncbi:MAG: phosphoribosyltransferase family protein [bacterium]
MATEIIKTTELPEVFSPASILEAYQREAKRIHAVYSPEDILTIIGVLKGGAFTAIDLGRAIQECDLNREIKFDFVQVKHYPDEGDASHEPILEPRLVIDTVRPVVGEHVLIVDEVGETSETLEFLVRTFGKRGAKSLRTFVLVDKPAKHTRPFKIDHVGINWPVGKDDWAFVCGEGMDRNGADRFRRGIRLWPKPTT